MQSYTTHLDDNPSSQFEVPVKPGVPYSPSVWLHSHLDVTMAMPETAGLHLGHQETVLFIGHIRLHVAYLQTLTFSLATEFIASFPAFSLATEFIASFPAFSLATEFIAAFGYHEAKRRLEATKFIGFQFQFITITIIFSFRFQYKNDIMVVQG